MKIENRDEKISELQEKVKYDKNYMFHTRVNFVYLALTGVLIKDLQTPDYSEKTIYYWVKQYLTKGIDSLKNQTIPGRTPKLTDQQKQELQEAINKSPSIEGYSQSFWDGILLAKHIKDKYDISFSVRRCQYLFHELGFTKQRGRIKPHRSDEQLRSTFLK
jgi:transposase